MPALAETAAVDRVAETLRFLSDRNRLRIILTLTEAETCVCDLIDDLGLPQPLVSYHLRKLRDAGLVRARRDAQWMYYSLDPDIWRETVEPLAAIVGMAQLPAAAGFGAGSRCDDMPPTPPRVAGGAGR